MHVDLELITVRQATDQVDFRFHSAWIHTQAHDWITAELQQHLPRVLRFDGRQRLVAACRHGEHVGKTHDGGGFQRRCALLAAARQHRAICVEETTNGGSEQGAGVVVRNIV